MKLVVDHMQGARRGQRQVFENIVRIAVGRHPENEVSFDGRRDIDASTRHAEIVQGAGGTAFVLRDLGSSNGIWIDGHQVACRELVAEQALDVEFGQGGPLLRLWLGEDDSPEPAPPRIPGWWRRFLRR